MKRSTTIISLCMAFLAIWLVAAMEIMMPLDPQYRLYIQWLPIILLVLFGVYAVLNIGYHVITFNQCPEAHQELERINAYYKAKKVDFSTKK